MTLFPSLTDLSNCRILISNDDGYQAEGIHVLEEIARTLSDDVWVVAPQFERSGAGHSLTIHDPLRFRQFGDQKYYVNGTPTDCVLVAVNHILKDQKPNLVLSGINHGANLGEDVHYSGTVAAAMEGTLLGLPAIAVSLRSADQDPWFYWDTARALVPDIIRKVAATERPANTLVNINVPGVPTDQVAGVSVVTQGIHKLGDELVARADPRGRPYLWIGAQRLADATSAGTDLHAIDNNAVTVTPLTVDLTDHAALDALRDVLED